MQSDNLFDDVNKNVTLSKDEYKAFYLMLKRYNIIIYNDMISKHNDKMIDDIKNIIESKDYSYSMFGKKDNIISDIKGIYENNLNNNSPDNKILLIIIIDQEETLEKYKKELIGFLRENNNSDRIYYSLVSRWPLNSFNNIDKVCLSNYDENPYAIIFKPILRYVGLQKSKKSKHNKHSKGCIIL